MTLVADVVVWVMSLSSGTTVWDDTQWHVENRLIPKDSTFSWDNNGGATFHLQRATRTDDPATGIITDAFLPTKGQYVAITDSTSTQPGVSGFTFYMGVFQAWDLEAIVDTVDCIGVVSAVGLGNVLDQIPLDHLHREAPSGTPAAGVAMDSHPTFNTEGAIQGTIVGNMVSGGDGNPQFAATPADCGTLWDRWSILETVCAYVASTSALLPTLVVSVHQTAVQTLLALAFEEVLPSDGMSIKGLLDYLCGPARGLNWFVFPYGSTWQITIFSGTDVAVGDIPAATTTTAILGKSCVSANLTSGNLDDYDAVEVKGSPIICCGTVSHIDGTLDKGWSATQETDYKTGVASTTNLQSYTLDQIHAMSRAIRGSPLLADVYARFILVQDSSGDFNCKNVSGVPVSGSTQALCPRIDWDGTTATVDASAKATPYAPEARLQHKLPWLAGVQGNGTDIRNAEQQARPSQIEPVILSWLHPTVYVFSNTDPLALVDLMHPPFSYWSETPSVSMDDRGPAIRIKYSYNEMLGWGPGGYVANAWDEYDPNNGWNNGVCNPASNWGYLVVTIAIPSDQPVKVINYKPGFTAANVRNVLRVRRPDMQCWLVRANTIVGMTLASGGTGALAADEVGSDTFVRNDFPIAQKLADELSAYAFRKRQGACIVLSGLALPSWALVGLMIDYMEEAGGASTPLFTLVNSIRFVYNPKGPRIIVSIGEAPMPAAGALVPAVPMFGGSVSIPLGGTQFAAQQKSEIAQRNTQKLNASILAIKSAYGAKSAALYGKIRWDCTGTGANIDQAECIITKFDGTTLGCAGCIGWILTPQSIRPTTFGGGAIYRLQPMGQVTRGTVTRMSYVAVECVHVGNRATAVQITGSYTSSSAIKYYIGEVLSNSNPTPSTPIQTNVTGTLANNFVLLSGVGLGSNSYAVGDWVDLDPSPVYGTPDPVVLMPCIVPAAWSSDRTRNAGGGWVVFGEYYVVEISAHIQGVVGAAGTNDSYVITGRVTLVNVAGGSVVKVTNFKCTKITMQSYVSGGVTKWSTVAADFGSGSFSSTGAGGGTFTVSGVGTIDWTASGGPTARAVKVGSAAFTSAGGAGYTGTVWSCVYGGGAQ